MHTEHTRLGADGRIVIPAALRAELNFQPGDPLVLESDGDSLLVRSFEAVIRETQEAFAPHRSARQHRRRTDRRAAGGGGAGVGRGTARRRAAA